MMLIIITAACAGRALAFSIPMPEAPGADVKSNRKAAIDYSNAQDGYVMIKYLERTNKQVRVIIKGPGGNSYTYTLNTNGDFEVYPLSDGSGDYSVDVFEQVEGTKYASANSAKIRARITDQFAPFLRPNQYVNYNPNSRAVQRAASITGSAAGLTEMISAVYNFVIENISYDQELARNVTSGYLPNIDAVLSSGKGICFDYSAVMAAMLRSLGIPCKLVVGHAGAVYHAWINAYSKETGWVNQVIFFDGVNWILMDPTFASSSNQSADIMQFIGDGSNYSAKFQY